MENKICSSKAILINYPSKLDKSKIFQDLTKKI